MTRLATTAFDAEAAIYAQLRSTTGPWIVVLASIINGIGWAAQPEREVIGQRPNKMAVFGSAAAAGASHHHEADQTSPARSGCTQMGFAVFMLRSLTWNEASIITFRVVQGLGGAFIMANSGAVIADLYPRELRGYRSNWFTWVGGTMGAVVSSIDWICSGPPQSSTGRTGRIREREAAARTRTGRTPPAWLVPSSRPIATASLRLVHLGLVLRLHDGGLPEVSMVSQGLVYALSRGAANGGRGRRSPAPASGLAAWRPTRPRRPGRATRRRGRPGQCPAARRLVYEARAGHSNPDPCNRRTHDRTRALR
jgi:hypothetical protein